MTRRRQSGFTLIEMIIVVTIIAVLAAISVGAFKRYMDSGRAAEAMAMLGELRNREEAYRAEFGSYYSTGAAESSLFPTLGSCTEPCPKTATSSVWPSQWTTLGVNPQRGQLYCGYVVVAGASGSAPSGTLGKGVLGASNITTPWWYAVAQCDNNRTVTNNTTYVTGYNTTVVSVQNEHQ